MTRTVRVRDKGQVTIPKALRRSLGITPGTTLVFEEQEGRLVARPSFAADGIEALVGAGGRRRTDEVIEELRGPRFRPDLDARRR